MPCGSSGMNRCAFPEQSLADETLHFLKVIRCRYGRHLPFVAGQCKCNRRAFVLHGQRCFARRPRSAGKNDHYIRAQHIDVVARKRRLTALAAPWQMRMDRNLDPRIRIPGRRGRRGVFGSCGKNPDHETSPSLHFLKRAAHRLHDAPPAARHQVNPQRRQPSAQRNGEIGMLVSARSHHADNGEAGERRIRRIVQGIQQFTMGSNRLVDSNEALAES